MKNLFTYFTLMMFCLVGLSVNAQNKSLHFDGTTYVEMDNVSWGSSFTVEMWIKPTDHFVADPYSGKTSGKRWRKLFGYDVAEIEGASKNGNQKRVPYLWILELDGGYGYQVGFLKDGTGTDNCIYRNFNGGLAYDTWVHIAWVHDGSTGKSIVYVNGEQDKFENGNLVEKTFDGNPIGSEKLRLGTCRLSNEGGGVSTQAGYRGDLDDFRVWSVARTSDEIKNNYDAELANVSSDLQLYLKMNQTNVGDLTQSGNMSVVAKMNMANPTGVWSPNCFVEDVFATLSTKDKVFTNEAKLVIDQNTISIVTDREVVSVEIFNMSGKKLSTSKVENNVVSFSSLNKGVYVLRAIDVSGNSCVKLFSI